MLSRLSPEIQRPQEDSSLPAPCALWPVDLKLTHVDCNPEDILVHFQGQYVTICELDYNILQVEIQNAQKTKVPVEVGEFCLVEDVLSSRWYRGRVQNQQKDLFDVFLLDHGNVLTVLASHLASASDELLMLAPKIVCGFFANVLPMQERWDSLSEKYFHSLIGSNIKGYIHALLPHKVLILEAPDITKDLLRLSVGKHVDTDTFLLLVEMLTEVPIKQSSESVPDLLMEKQNGQEFSFKPSSLQGFENILSFCGPKLTVGKKERVRVTAAVNPGAFYCQRTCMATDLKEMSDKLALLCESKSKDAGDKPVGNLGLLCAARGKDEKWHRGFVQFLPVNSQVRVLFVDYGFCESVKVDNILQLPSDCLLTPIMSFLCALSCLSEQGETVKNQQLNILKNGLLGGVLNVKIDDFNKEQNLYSVTLYNAEEQAAVEPKQIQHVAEQTKCDVFENEPNLPQNFYPLRCTNETVKVQMSDSVHLEEFQEDSVFEGYVEHIQNPNDFWMRTAKRNHNFEDMMNRMMEYYSGKQLDEDILEDPVPGMLCCAMYEKDMHYYRAMVTDTLENGAEVFFIDFGNTEKVPSMVIKALPEQFAIEPEFALNCSLAHIVPMGDVWTVVETEYFRQATSNNALLVHVVHNRNDLYVVDLYERGTENRESITVHMTSAQMAEYWKYTPTDAPTEAVQEYKEKGKKKFGKMGRVDGSSKSIVPKHCPNVATQESWKATENIKERNVDTTETPKQKAPSRVEYFKPQKFQPGAELTVRCSHCNSPSDFWCQTVSQMSNLNKLMEKMQHVYQTHTDPLQPLKACCAVKFLEDGRWYRGCTIGGKNDEVDVILVDYGIIVKERVHNLRALMPEFLELKGQAFRCSLYNLIEPADGNGWSREACNLLKDFASGSSVNLTCSIRAQLYVQNQGLSNVVDLHTPFQRATSHLVEKGVAMLIQSPKQLLPSVYPCSFVYSSFNIGIGSEEQVYATQVYSPWEIYCQLDRNGEIIEDLMEKVTRENPEVRNPSFGPNIGNVCLAKYFGDGKWYRSFTQPVQSNVHLNVFFVDYGNKQMAEKSSVMPIPRKAVDLLLVPMQALKCSLSEIPKGENLAEVNRWLEKVILNRPVQARFVAKDNDGTFICDLFDGDIHINEKVKELIAIHGQNENSVKGPATECHYEVNQDGSRLNSTAKTKGRRLKTKVNSEGASGHRKSPQGKKQSSITSKLKSVMVPNNQKDVIVRQGNMQSEENTTLKLEAKVVEQQDTPVSIKLQNSTTALPKLSDLPDTKIKLKGAGFVSHINSVNNFFIQMEDDEQRILKMGEELNSQLFTENMEDVASEASIGDLVAAEYEEDDALYRAVVTDNSSGGHLTVEFVDYGNAATVDRKKTYRLTSVFLSQPRLSTPCTLVKPHRFWDDQAFTDALTGKALVVEFVKCLGSQWEVSINIRDDSPSYTVPDVRGFGQAKDEEVPASSINPEQAVADNIAQDEKQAHDHPGTCEGDTEETMKTMEKSQSNTQTNGVTGSINANNHAHLKKIFSKTKQKKRASVQVQTLQTRRNHMYATCKRYHNKSTHRAKAASPIKSYLPESVINPKLRRPETVLHGKAVSIIDWNTLETLVELAESTGIPQQDIGAGQAEDGTLMSVLENGELYVRLKRNAEQFDALGNLINENMTECHLVGEKDVEEGLECLIKSDQIKQWCRAAVCHASVDEGKCSVLLLDHGTTEVISVKCIKELCADLKQIPVQAVRCKWNGLGDSIKEADEILRETLKAMMGQNIKLMFVSYSDALQHWMVEIMMNGQFLIQNLKTVYLQHVEDQLPLHPMSNTCPKEEKPCMDKEGPPQKLFLAPVKMDVEYSGFAAAVTTPGEFYVVLEDLLLIMNTVSNILEDLPEALAPLPEANLTPGSGCLLKSEEKKKWCRAEIVHIDDTSVVIDLVDYGHCAHVPYQDVSLLKRLPEELAGLPKVTYPCLLRGIKPASEAQWSDVAVVFFQECICQKNLQIYFRQYVSEAQWEVDVVTGGINLAKELVDAGHASYIDSMLGLRFQQDLSPNRLPQHRVTTNYMENIVEIAPVTNPGQIQNSQELKKLAQRPDKAERPLGNCEDLSSEDVSHEPTEKVPFQDLGRDGWTEASVRNDVQGTEKKYLGATPGARQCVQM